MVGAVVITTVTKMPKFYIDFRRTWKDQDFVGRLRTMKWVELFLAAIV